MEVTPDFVEADWCIKGHIGMVLEGTLELTFPERTYTYQPGEAYLIPVCESHRHKARALSPVVRIVMVEDV
jgi:quercetin dioxygenase-like cupin family protein